MNNKEVAIRVKNLNKTFRIYDNEKHTLRSLFSSFFNQGKVKEFKALDNINFEIYKGEFVGIVGRNGSGKSTLLKIIAGIFSPDKGSTVDYSGRLVPFLELGVGFNPDLSGRENIFLNGTILGMGRHFLEEKFDEIVDFAEIRQFIDMPVKNYSSGMMVRLAFSIAIQANADIYLLDEVLAVGDENFQKKSAKVIRKLQKEGKTFIFISHSMETIRGYCDRALLVDRSQLLMEGSPYIVTEEYKRLNSPVEKESDKVPGKKDDRWGNEGVVIENVRIENSKKEEVSEFREIEDLIIRIKYKRNNSKHVDGECGIAIYRDDGVYFNATNTKIHNVDFKFKDEGEIVYKTSSKYFLDQKYLVTIAIRDRESEEDLDYISNRFVFRISTRRRDHGVVALPVEWIIDGL